MRIKDYVINLQNMAYIHATDKYIEFGFAFPVSNPGGQNYIRFEKGNNLSDAEFELVREYLLDLSDPHREILI